MMSSSTLRRARNMCIPPPGRFILLQLVAVPLPSLRVKVDHETRQNAQDVLSQGADRRRRVPLLDGLEEFRMARARAGNPASRESSWMAAMRNCAPIVWYVWHSS